jgi:hypothetical protein
MNIGLEGVFEFCNRKNGEGPGSNLDVPVDAEEGVIVSRDDESRRLRRSHSIL